MAFLTFRGSSTSPAIPQSTTAANVPLTNTQIDGNFASLNTSKLETAGGTISGNLTIAGNLTVNGTTTKVDSTVVTLKDPVITLGGDTALTSDDGKDRGVEFRWHNGSTSKIGFFGFDDSTGKFTFIPDAINTSEVFSGTKGTLDANIEWADVLNKPDPVVTVTLTGDVTGTANTTLTDLASGTISISTTIAADRVTLTSSQITSGLGYTPYNSTNPNGYITYAGRAYPRRSDGGDLNFYWSGQSGQPTWLWGGTDGTNMYVYNPSNFDVNYATTAGSAPASSVTSAVLGSGTASSTTFLRGDRTWATITSGASLSNDTTTNSDAFYPTMAYGATSGAPSTLYVASTEFYFNPGTGTLNSTAFNSLSDRRAKTDLQQILSALEKVTQLTGYTFTMIESNQRSTGLIAQDVEKVLPEAVGGTESQMNVNYGAMMGLIVEAIKELNVKLDDIQKQLSNK